MCYTVSQLVNKRLKEAKKSNESQELIDKLTKLYNDLAAKEEDTYMLGGFSPTAQIPIAVDQNDPKVELADWGLIPFFIKTGKDKISFRRNTLNAKSETLLELRSFKDAARYRRCVICLDGFFEYHHHNDKKYPFFMKMKDGQPIYLAGIWNDWTNKETGEVHRTVSIVTTEANEIMRHIHNNPKNPNRMPVIIPAENMSDWMTPFEKGAPVEKFHKELISDLTRPYQGTDMLYTTVPKLLGKDGVGNSPDAIEEFQYQEILELDWYAN